MRMPFHSSSPSLLTLSVSLSTTALSSATLSALSASLLQNVMAQRAQMPLQWEVLNKELNTAKNTIRHMEEVEEDTESSGDLMDDAIGPRVRIKRRKERVQRLNKLKKFVRQASEFVQRFQLLLSNLKDEVEQHGPDIEVISFLLGATPVSPREVYHLYPPRGAVLWSGHVGDNGDTANQTATKRATLQLFRAMVTHDALFERMGKRIQVANMFVAIKKKKKTEVDLLENWLIPKPEYSNLQRGKVTEFKLNCCATPGVDPKRRILFGTPMTTEKPPRATYTPVPMDMCTPCPSKSVKRLLDQDRDKAATLDDSPVLKPLCVEMIETPCASAKAGSKRGHGRDSVATPLYERRMPLITGSEDKKSAVEDLNLDVMSLEDDYEWYISAVPIKGFKDPRI